MKVDNPKVDNPVVEIREKAPQDLDIILKGENGYEENREVVNLRFDYYPYGIAFCKTADHVSFCIKKCKEFKVKLRIRSGGHHHEGMSSAEDVLMIDLSKMYDKKIVYENETNEFAWIPPGKKLKKIYEELEKDGVTIPGGVCDSVNVGGLTQGVGWGISTRKWGYTCDNIEAVEIVKADGEIVVASDELDNKYRDLFWAVRGGGGGNFGVVTRFLFRLSPLANTMTQFVLTYHEDDTRAAVHQWANFQLDLAHDKNITVGGRLFVTKKKKGKLILGGLYYGSLMDAQRAIQPLLITRPIKEAYTIINKSNRTTSAATVTAAISYLGDVFNPTAPASSPKMIYGDYDYDALLASAPRKTCEGKHPNKVSSAFPKDNSPKTIKALINATVDYIELSTSYPDLNNYVSLHGIGGKAQEEPAGGTPYPFRDKPFLFKIQAWWNKTTDKSTKNDQYVQWVRDFKTAIAPYTDGAFINFQDKDLVENPNTPEGRIALLAHYYKEHLPRLRAMKKKYDSCNLFEFGMSIPLEKKQ